MSLFKSKYRIEPARLNGYDYGWHGLYYITICTKNRIHYFGEVIETHNTETPDSMKETHNNAKEKETHNCASLRATEMGKIANQYWMEIPTHYPFVELDEFVVMPNHLHGILFLKKPDYAGWNENKFGPQSQNIPAIIRAYKSSVKRFANINQIVFDWQSRYHDHIIRDEKELDNIRNYIASNLQNWAK